MPPRAATGNRSPKPCAKAGTNESDEKKDIPTPTPTPTDYMCATTWIQPEWESCFFKWSSIHQELIQRFIALGSDYYAAVPTPIDVVNPETYYPFEGNHWDNTIYYQSPDGKQWWHTTHHYGNDVWVISGAHGERGTAHRRECDTIQRAFAQSIALAAQKEVAGWKCMADPRGEYQSHQWDASFSRRYYRWSHAPATDPYVGLWSYSITGVIAESILLPDGDDRNATTLKRWWSSPEKAKAGIDAWIDEKTAQGYVEIQQPSRAYHEAQGKSVYHCPDGKACTHTASQDHQLKYWHPHPDELDNIEEIQKTCENPLLVEAWKRDRVLMKQQLRETTPPHMHSMLDEIVDRTKPSMRTYWQPVVTKHYTRQSDIPITHSKVHGSPYIPKDQEWPKCSICDRKLWFLFQINCSELPSRLRGILGNDNQMIQFYICATNDMECGGTPEKRQVGTVVRMVTWSEDGGRSAQEVGTSQFLDDDDYHLDECDEGILTWEECEEKDGPLVQYDPEYPQMWMKDEVFAHWKAANGDSGYRPEYGDKIAGFACYSYPRARVVLPRCSICHNDMRYIIQVASEHYFVPFLWGDSGRGQIFQCPIHKESLAFDWSCY